MGALQETPKAAALDGTDAKLKLVRKRVSSLIPSPENTLIYRPTYDDPDITKLARDIKKNGCDPLRVTLDGFILSGHRRHKALKINKTQFVRCLVWPIRRDEMPQDQYILLLRELNEQRHKTVAEQVREAMIDVSAEDAHKRLRQQRNKLISSADDNGVQPLNIGGRKPRPKIGDDKADHVKYILEVVEQRRQFWPLSVRAVHYPLLNFNFVRGYYWPRRHEAGYGKRRVLRYLNDDGSYDATSELITRLRLDGTIPWKAFHDPTRPLTKFEAFKDVREYMRQAMSDFGAGYWRDLLQSQPNHVEVVVEKNTVYHMAQSVTEKYQIPTSSGRGFGSIDMWHELNERYRKSRKDCLVVIVLSDFDPEGEWIPLVGGQTLRDDFGVEAGKLRIIKAGVTKEQILKYNLPSMNFAKESSSNHQWFVDRNGGDDSVYELEALNPADMLRDLDNVIRSVIDVELYNREVEIEKSESPYLETFGKRVKEVVGTL